ncbi:MAG: CAAX prenyl protease-related protein [Verrucomicrobia bacterium]|nr:CAAX prenyl protease-related protein [Verrucomicrobiota bacterium]
MHHLIGRLEKSPLLARVVPFVAFAALTSAQGFLGEGSRYWLYLVKTLLGAWLIWLVRPWVSEMRWKFSWEGVAAGVVVFGLWVGLEGLYPKFGSTAKVWNPHEHFGAQSGGAWFFIWVRVLGSSLVVPPLEEVFYRSFLYRYIVNPGFQGVPLGHFGWTPFLVTAAIFGFVHFEWLPAILCAAVYQGLVIWKQRLGDAMTAHAVTNFLLGLWVIWKGAWNFW